MTAKAKRLAKVAKELNVGTGTIFDFLESEKIEFERSPNAKLSPETYERLLEKFQPDMLVKQKKEEAKKQAERDREEFLSHEIKRKEKPAPKPSSSKDDDTVLIKSNVVGKSEDAEAKSAKPETPKEEKPEETKKETQIQEEQTQEVTEAEQKPAEKPKEAPEKAKQEESVKEEKPEETEKVEPTKVEKPADPAPESEKPAEATKEETPKEEAEEKPRLTEEKTEEGKSGLKVLGKINLEDFKKKSKKGAPKKTEKTAEKKEEPKAKPEEKVEEKAAPKEETAEEVPKEKTAEEKPKTEEAEAAKRAEERAAPSSRGDVDLKGLTVVGKIDVEKFKKKEKPKPVASSADSDSLKKKKRKRKRIVSDKPGGSGQQGRGGQSGPGRGGQSGPGQSGPGRGGQQQQGGQRKRKRTEKVELDDKQVQQQIKDTLSRLTGKDKRGQKTKLKKKKREIQRQRREEEELQRESESKVLEVTEFITVNDLANMMSVNVTEVITAFMSLGIMVSINQRIDAETIQIVAEEFGYEVQFKDVEMDEPSLEEADQEGNLQERPPIVTIMGHVDHGKTSLLDFIRKTNVIAGEAGGITQHIGAYEVTLDDGRQITFLDTPGHEAFTAMRARGAQVTDLAIIIIAADDDVMPQTKEAISHAQAAGVPMVFAINKIDREAAKPDNIRQQLADMNILVEEWGGKYQCQEISAKKGLNIQDLLDRVLFEAEILELKADAEKRAVGTVIESWLDRGRGIVSTVLVQGGTLRVGDTIIAGANFGKVKAMTNERGKRVEEAGPSTPVQILGFDGAPAAGDKLYVTKTDSEAKEIAVQRQQLKREQGIRATKHVTLDEIGRRIAVGNFKELNVIVKGDVDGSVEALSDALLKQSTEEIQINVIHKAVGQITESDVLLASASDAIIIGFQVRPSGNARSLAEKEQIDMRLYSVIYQAIEEVKQAMEGMLEPTTEEKVVGTVEIRDTFRISKVGTIAGCYVTSGKVFRNSKIRLIREGVVKWDGKLASLKRFKDDVKEVNKGYECGLNLENYNDVKVGDYLEVYEEVEVKRKLS